MRTRAQAGSPRPAQLVEEKRWRSDAAGRTGSYAASRPRRPGGWLRARGRTRPQGQCPGVQGSAGTPLHGTGRGGRGAARRPASVTGGMWPVARTSKMEVM